MRRLPERTTADTAMGGEELGHCCSLRCEQQMADLEKRSAGESKGDSEPDSWGRPTCLSPGPGQPHARCHWGNHGEEAANESPLTRIRLSDPPNRRYIKMDVEKWVVKIRCRRCCDIGLGMQT